MRTRLLLLYVICQTIITEALGGVTLPFPDFVGKVTPIKPKPLPPSVVSLLSASPITKSSLKCDGKDIIPKLFSPSPETREFSSLLAFTSSSRALPVPKIDSLSIADVKMPERLREKFLLQKLRNPVSDFRPDTPDVSLPRKSPHYQQYSPLTLEARNPSFSEQINSNNLSPLTSCSLPYPLYYQSMYLPGVRTPFETSINSLPVSNDPYLTTYLNPIQTAEIPKPINTIQPPKPPLNVPVSIKPVLSSQNAAAKNLWLPLEANSGSAFVTFESRFKQPDFLSPPVLKDCTDPIMLRSSMPYLLADKIPDFKLKTCTPPIIKPSAFGPPSNFLNSPPTFLAPISLSPQIVDVLLNRLSSIDSSKNTNTSDMFPNICAYIENNIEKLNENGSNCNCQTFVDSKKVPRLERINLSRPFAPKLASYQHPSFTGECVRNPLKYSPPIIPHVPIPTIFSGSCAYSPITYFPSQTPSSISYVNQYPSSIAQSTANMVSSITDLVSSIAEHILSSYKSHIDSATPNISQRPTCTITEFLPKKTLPVVSLSQGNKVITEPVLPICINPPAIESSTISSSDASCKSSAFDVSSNKPLRNSAKQPTASVIPPTSLITLSSPQLCPSYLPSPCLPSYPTISSPFYMEAPVFKVSSSKKDPDVEDLIELMLLAEILNNDERFDWDDLNTLLNFLSVS